MQIPSSLQAPVFFSLYLSWTEVKSVRSHHITSLYLSPLSSPLSLGGMLFAYIQKDADDGNDLCGETPRVE